MKNIKFNFLIVFALIFVAANSSCQNTIEKRNDTNQVLTDSIKPQLTIAADTAVQKPVGWVNDFEHIIDNKTIDTLTFLISDFQEKTAVQIAVVTTASFSPHTTINDYATWLGNKWGIGLKEINNGILVVVSSTQRQVRISTGLGMEQLLPDQQCQEIVNTHMLPSFKQGNYAMGISSGVKEIMRVLLLQALK